MLPPIKQRIVTTDESKEENPTQENFLMKAIKSKMGGTQDYAGSHDGEGAKEDKIIAK